MAYDDIYIQVTARILAELEKGAVPWVKPWSATPGANVPCNAVSNRPYSGTNVILLWIAANEGWPTPRFLTFKQAKEAGGYVRTGEKSTRVVFMRKYVTKDKTPGADPDAVKQGLVLKEYSVFNVAQCDGLPERIVNGPTVQRMRNPDTRDELADDYLVTTGADIREGHGQAMFVPSMDFIGLPKFADFMNADNFYNTAFHELTHWTGTKDRCDRKLTVRFGDQAYAAEELVAELGAAFQSAEFGFDGDVRDAGYIAHWIRLLKDDNKAFFTAASAAQKAVDFLRGKALEETAEAA
jgi:antirestriction protein ArdC